MLTNDQKAIAALSAALVATISVAVITSTDEPSTTAPTIDLGSGVIDAHAPTPQPAQLDLDSRQYHAQVQAYRDQHPGTVDLLSGTVEPGASVTTGVTVERGSRASDVQAVGGSWSIGAPTARDDDASTWIEVTATNTGTEPARFVAIVTLQ